MKIADVRDPAFAMPLNDPSYPRGPYRFYDREYMVIAYRTDLDALRALVPEPLEVTEPIVKYVIHPHAGFDWLWRLHGIRSGDSGQLSRREGRFRPFDVSRRRSADRGRA